jgi:micrococcal nuclease
MHQAISYIVIAVVVLVLYDLIVGLPWIGRVDRVVDGDSVEATVRGRFREIRLVGIDAPEYKQEHGKDARSALASLIEHRLVLFVPKGRDMYGRQLCIMATSSGFPSWSLASAGHAWPGSIATTLLHAPARAMGRGLWAGQPIRPSEWRRANPR